LEPVLTFTRTPPKVWDLSIVQGPFSVAPCQTLTIRFATSLQSPSQLTVSDACKPGHAGDAGSERVRARATRFGLLDPSTGGASADARHLTQLAAHNARLQQGACCRPSAPLAALSLPSCVAEAEAAGGVQSYTRSPTRSRPGPPLCPSRARLIPQSCRWHPTPAVATLSPPSW
jgi:hypothetical protein